MYFIRNFKWHNEVAQAEETLQKHGSTQRMKNTRNGINEGMIKCFLFLTALKGLPKGKIVAVYYVFCHI